MKTKTNLKARFTNTRVNANGVGDGSAAGSTPVVEVSARQLA